MPEAPGPRQVLTPPVSELRPDKDPRPLACVYLVGAGPGDPGLLTVRAAGLLAQADAVFHDELVPRAILDQVRPGAKIIGAGHRAGQTRRPLGDAIAAMAARARRGELVIRLKGGDPFLFGRGAEEAQALLAAGVAFEVVPGISSALAAPAAAGIAVTHRDLASSVTIVTGHERSGGGRVSWERLAGSSDTLVVLMGATRLTELCREIIAAGRDPITPAAVVMSATCPEQRQVVGTLAALPALAAEAEIGSPAVLVVGEVASLASVLGRGATLTSLAELEAQAV